MAEFNGFILTNKGRELLTKAIAGETLTFTKISFGDGLYEGDKKEVTELVGLKSTFPINQIKRVSNEQIVLKTIISNKDIETGYHIKEIGIYGICDNKEEVLYAYNSAIEADYLPAFNENNLIELEYQNYILIDQAKKVTAVIDASAAYLTKEEASEVYVPKTQIANESDKGILSLDDIRNTEITYVLGSEYGGKFCEELIEVKGGKVYYYWNEIEKRYIPYLAMHTKTYIGGIVKPEVSNFENMDVRSNLLYKKLTITSPDISGFHLVNAYIISNLIFITAFVTDPIALNKVENGTKIFNLKSAIPELSSYSVNLDVISSINLILSSDFTLIKSHSEVEFYGGQHFSIISGIYK